LGVDIKFYKPVFENRKKYILSVGRDNGRDYSTVIQVAKKMPDTEFHLVLSERNLKGINDLPTNVKVFLDIPFSVLKGKYEEAFALLLVTHPDGFLDGSDCSGQTVLLDAFASGLPVIATQKAYLSDYGKDGIDLLLVRPYDSDQIMSSISKIDEMGISMAKNARLKVETNFSTEEMGKRLSNLFLK
jgi:glycosyltransferase involved in cell wall biosynthesis